MKKSKLFLLALGTTLTIASCKKGENDPFLSLKTRNSRIVGIWELSTANSENSQTYQYPDTTIFSNTTTVYSNGIEIRTGNYPDTSFYTLIMDLKKDGTSIINQIYTDEDNTDSLEFSSTWWWANDTKNKTGIVLDGENFNIDRLTDNELILKQESYNLSSSPDGYDNSIVKNNTMTFTKTK